MTFCTVLAEKPSQALAYAQACNSMTKKDGYFEVEDSMFGNKQVIITFGFGHLVELAPPEHYSKEWEKWDINALPIFPQEYEFIVSKEKKKQFNIVADFLKKSDEIIIATDSDREGENIAWSIIMKAKAYDKSKSYKRLWINSLEKDAIREGFKNLRNGLDYVPFYLEAKARQISDWLIGMNGSPLYTLSLRNNNVDGVFSLGRVQTPTLYLIYKRQEEIKSFVKKPFFEIVSNNTSNDGEFEALLNPNEKFPTKENAEQFALSKGANIGAGEAIVKNVETKERKTNSPQLFALSTLQSKVNKLYKATANDTLKAVQSLYEKRLLTYPRTDTPFITENEFNYLKANLQSYAIFLNLDIPLTNKEPRKRYVDNSKVQEHHAIVLTKKVVNRNDFEKLSDLEKKVYMLVAKTTVAMFAEDYKYNETIIDLAVAELNFRAKGQVPTQKGWKTIFEKEPNTSDGTEETKILPKVQIGDVLKSTLKLKEKETQPPKAYNEGTLITAMKTAGKTIEDEQAQEVLKEVEGIGTEATRSSIIETLKNKEYIATEKNNLVVTQKGQILCKAVQSQKLLTSAEMTAKWETYLKKIGKREGTLENFVSNIQKFILHLIESVPNEVAALDMSEYKKAKKVEEEKSIIGNCPKCSDGHVKMKKNFYGCTNYPQCKFTLSDNFRKKKLTKTNIKELLENKETVVKNIKKADKNTYNAKVKLTDKGYIEFDSFAK